MGLQNQPALLHCNHSSCRTSGSLGVLNLPWNLFLLHKWGMVRLQVCSTCVDEAPIHALCSMESVKGLCWLQQMHTEVQIQESSRAWPFGHWCVTFLGSAIRCLVGVESHLSPLFIVYTGRWSFLCEAFLWWRTASLHIQTSSSANKENLLC